jgi:hypothetical protein
MQTVMARHHTRGPGGDAYTVGGDPTCREANHPDSRDAARWRDADTVINPALEVPGPVLAELTDVDTGNVGLDVALEAAQAHGEGLGRLAAR